MCERNIFVVILIVAVYYLHTMFAPLCNILIFGAPSFVEIGKMR